MFEREPILVMLCCNNPDNGLFDGRVCAIEVGDNLRLVAHDLRGPRMRWLPGDKIAISGMHFRYVWCKGWYGNWCWDAVKMPGADVIRMLNKMRGKFDVEEAEERLFNWWKAGGEWKDADCRLLGKTFS